MNRASLLSFEQHRGFYGERMDDNEKQRPVHEYRLGRIRLTIWGRDGGSDGVEYYSVISRLYKNDEDEWSHAYGFWPEDLPIVLKLVRNSDDWICKRKTKDALQAQNF